LFQRFAKEAEFLSGQLGINRILCNKPQFERTVSVFSNELFSIYQWSNERSRRGQEGQDAQFNQSLRKGTFRRSVELKQKLGLGFIDSPISQFRYRFAYGFFIRLISSR
jgi:hypothetical protein